MAAQVFLDQPGLFVVRRPLLSLVLVISALALIGFYGGGLLSSEIRATVFQQIQTLMVPGLLAAGGLAIPLLAPSSPWGRHLLAGSLLASGALLVLFSSGSGATLTGGSVVIVTILIVLALASLVMLQPITGRAVPLAAIGTPFLGMIGLTAVAAYLGRLNIGQADLLAMLLLFGLSVAVFAGAYFAAAFAGITRQAKATAPLAAGLSLNRLFRDLIFWALTAGLIFQTYSGEELRAQVGLSSGWLAGMVVILAALPVLIATAGILALSVRSAVPRYLRERSDHQAYLVFSEILMKTNRAGLVAAFFIWLLLALVFVVEMPFNPVTGAGEQALLISTAGHIGFYLLVFVLTAMAYLSLRMGALVAVVLCVTDLFASGVLALFPIGSTQPPVLTETIPRFLSLLVLVHIAKSWSAVLRDHKNKARQITRTFAIAAGPAILALLCCTAAFSGFAFLQQELSGEAGYMALRLAVQGISVLLFLPAAMSVLSRLRFTL